MARKRAGEKCLKKKKTRKGKNNVKMQPLTNVFQLDVPEYDLELDKEKKSSVWQIYWHSDEDFYVLLIDEKEFERAKSCESSKLAFPRKNRKCGYDLAVVHKERYKRPNISDSGKRLSPIITNQLGREFYCVKKDRLLKRHPYFLKRMLFMRKDVSVKLSNKLSTSERTTSF